MLRLSRRLDDRFRALRYDRRGYARSIGVGPPWTLSANVDDLEALLDSGVLGADLDGAFVFGHSLGGNVALALAARRPDLVRGVVIYETPLSWMPWWPRNTAGAAAVATTDTADAAETFMRRLVGETTWEQLPEATKAARRSEGPAMVAELDDLRAVAPWEASDVSTPVLALCGERGREHHRRAMKELVEILPECRTATVTGAGHGGPNSHAAAVAAEISAFVDEVSDRRTVG
jgi:pimeloyl-ACP methyl ester carboxylesterase